jgi:hypothetical protein
VEYVDQGGQQIAGELEQFEERGFLVAAAESV